MSSSAMYQDLGIAPQGALDFSKSMIQGNKTRTLNAPFKAQQIRFNALKSIHIKNGDPDRAWKSHATNFARGGIDWQGSNYVRDPRTGVWFKETSNQKFPGLEKSPLKSYVGKDIFEDGRRPTTSMGLRTRSKPALDMSLIGGAGSLPGSPSSLQRSSSAPGTPTGLRHSQDPGSPSSPSSSWKRCVSRPDVIPHLSVTLEMH